MANISPIHAKGELAKELASVTKMSVESLDRLDGKKDGKINLFDPKTFSSLTMVETRAAGRPVVVVDNGNGKVDGGDYFIHETAVDVNGKFERVFIGGRLSRLLNGYETTGSDKYKRVNKEIHPLTYARNIFSEIQKRGLVGAPFSGFHHAFPDIAVKWLSRV